MFEQARSLDIEYLVIIPESRRADKCIGCNICSKRCPQNIDIPKELKMIHAKAMRLSMGIDIESLKDKLKNNTILVCFGAGAMGHAALSALRECGIEADYFCDNSESLWGSEVDGVKVISPTQLQDLNNKQEIHVVITSSYYREVKAQLASIGIKVCKAL
jgi:ferredoxin